MKKVSILSFLFFIGFLFCKEKDVIASLADIELEHEQSGLKNVDAIYIINLERRPEKKQQMQKLFAANNLYPNFIKAIDGRNLNKKEFLRLTRPYKQTAFDNFNQVGCLLSHLSCLYDAYKRGFELVWICEDDILFLKDVHKIPVMIENLSKIDPNWDILYTDRNHTSEYWRPYGKFLRPKQTKIDEDFFERIMVNDVFIKEKFRFGTYSYFFSSKGIKKVLDFFFNNPIYLPIDHELHYIENIKEYSLADDWIAVNRNSFSDTINQ